MVRLLRGAAVLLLCMGTACAALLWYARPDPALDWDIGELPNWKEKAVRMIEDLSLSAVITEEELNAMLKQELYKRRELNDVLWMTGADASLNGNVLTVRTDLEAWEMLRFQLTHRFQLEWDAPNLRAVHVSTSLKEVELPPSWVNLGIVTVPLSLDSRIPAAVENVIFEEKSIRIQFSIQMMKLFS